jgi:hypothetical protein
MCWKDQAGFLHLRTAYVTSVSVLLHHTVVTTNMTTSQAVWVIMSRHPRSDSSGVATGSAHMASPGIIVFRLVSSLQTMFTRAMGLARIKWEVGVIVRAMMVVF